MQNKKILLVEDESLNALFFKSILTHAGYLVWKIVATGEEAIESIKEELPALILMDIRLAGKIDGIETAREIKMQINVPVIFMTGYSDKNYMERAAELNPVRYFIKPIIAEDLVAAINLVLG